MRNQATSICITLVDEWPHCGICPPSHQPDEYGTRPFFWWVQAQGRSPHAPGMVKNTFDPVGIPLIRGAAKEVKAWGDDPWGQGNLQLPRHTQPDPYPSQHGRPKCDPDKWRKRSVNTAAAQISTSTLRPHRPPLPVNQGLHEPEHRSSILCKPCVHILESLQLRLKPDHTATPF